MRFSFIGDADDGDLEGWERFVQQPSRYFGEGDSQFAGNGDGLHVVRTAVDEGNHVHETDETAYAFIRIIGETVTPIERGWGLSPWDPTKVIFSGAGPASRRELASSGRSRREDPGQVVVTRATLLRDERATTSPYLP